jgi:hypothetical protein
LTFVTIDLAEWRAFTETIRVNMVTRRQSELFHTSIPGPSDVRTGTQVSSASASRLSSKCQQITLVRVCVRRPERDAADRLA